MVPAVAVVAVAAVVAAPHASAASPHPKLPARTAAQLLAAVETSKTQALSGTIRTVTNLGLPTLPDALAGAGSGLPALLSGTHTLRLWVDGGDHQRLALLSDLDETDVVHNGADVWTYQSRTNTVTHSTLDRAAGAQDNTASKADAAAQELTPPAQATKALAAIDPTTAVTVDRTARVAGHPAYQLVLTPRATATTLVRSVTIALDAATDVPLRVRIYAAGSRSAAFETGFTEVHFAPPAASVFRFTPPAGATTTKSTTHAPTAATGTDSTATDAVARPTTTGKGWATVLELPAGTLSTTTPAGGSGDRSDRSLSSMLDRLTTPVGTSRLLTTRLLTAVITADGRVFIGAVPASVVEQAAGA
jgi:outer membrane lipoprotein-sorting protein